MKEHQVDIFIIQKLHRLMYHFNVMEEYIERSGKTRKSLRALLAQVYGDMADIYNRVANYSDYDEGEEDL